MNFDDFLKLMGSLESNSVEYVLVGGMALGIHGLVRTTDDVDLFVRAEPENVARLKRALSSVWNDPEIDGISAADLAGDYPTIRYVPPQGEPVIDLIARLGTEFQFEDLESQTITLEGTRIRAATPRMLYRMKKDTLRPIDRADAAALREKFGKEVE